MSKAELKLCIRLDQFLFEFIPIIFTKSKRLISAAWIFCYCSNTNCCSARSVLEMFEFTLSVLNQIYIVPCILYYSLL